MLRRPDEGQQRLRPGVRPDWHWQDPLAPGIPTRGERRPRARRGRGHLLEQDQGEGRGDSRAGLRHGDRRGADPRPAATRPEHPGASGRIIIIIIISTSLFVFLLLLLLLLLVVVVVVVVVVFASLSLLILIIMMLL